MEGCSLERVLIRERLLIREGVLIRGGVSRSGGRLLEGVLIREDAHYRGCLLERGGGGGCSLERRRFRPKGAKLNHYGTDQWYLFKQ